MVENLLPYVKDEHFYKRYEKFINFAIKRNGNGLEKSKIEKHHILPKSIFPSLSKDKNNIVILTLREHFVIHYILAKAVRRRDMWYAFNMMNRITKYSKKSVLYESARMHISKALSVLNSGREMSFENRKKVSERTKGTLLIRDENGEIKRVPLVHPKYLSGKYVSIRVGYKHKPSTKKKMSVNNGVKGKKRYYSKTGKRSIFVDPDKKMDSKEWGVGLSDNEKCVDSEKIKGLRWITNGKENVRTKDDLPDGWRLGRTFDNVGYKTASKLPTYIDLGTLNIVKTLNPKRSYAPFPYMKLDKLILYMYDETIFTIFKDLCKYLSENGIHLSWKRKVSIENLDEYRVNIPQNSCNKEVNEFRRLHSGKSLKELGIEYAKIFEHHFDIRKLNVYRRT